MVISTMISIIYHKIKEKISIKDIIGIKEEYALKKDISVQESRALMEYLVNEALMEWQVYNVDPSTDNYMSEENISASIQYIIKKIMLEMTPTCRVRLSVGYPMQDEMHMIESIKNKAKLVVLNYTIKQNNNDLNTDIPNINAF